MQIPRWLSPHAGAFLGGDQEAAAVPPTEPPSLPLPACWHAEYFLTFITRELVALHGAQGGFIPPAITASPVRRVQDVALGHQEPTK